MLIQFLCGRQEWIKDSLTAIVWCHVLRRNTHTYCAPHYNVRVLKCGLQGREQPDADWSARTVSTCSPCYESAGAGCLVVSLYCSGYSHLTPSPLPLTPHTISATLHLRQEKHVTVQYCTYSIHFCSGSLPSGVRRTVLVEHCVLTHVQEEIYLVKYQITLNTTRQRKYTECIMWGVLERME